MSARSTRLAGSVLLLPWILLASSPASSAPPDWENEQVVGYGKEPPRATALPCPDRASARKGTREASPWFKSLAGRWKFHWAPSPDERPQEFFRTDFDD